MAITLKSSWPWVRSLLHPTFDQSDAEAAGAQDDRAIDALADKLLKGRGAPRGRPRGLAGIHRVPHADPAPDLVQQSLASIFRAGGGRGR